MKRILLSLFCATLFMSCKPDDLTDNNPPVPPVNDDQEVDESFFYEQCLYSPGDYGSKNWRIPALLALPDGSLLAVNDKRKYNETDLPEDIDIVARISHDKGRTWSEPITIIEGTGYKQGYGDAALVLTASGDVVCAFVGGNGLWASTQDDPQYSYICRSNDGGRTWSQPVDITRQLWGDEATHQPGRNYKASFFGSGNGLRLTRGAHAGRIMFVAAMCRKNANVLDNFVVYSDDEGRTWNVSDKAFSSGDEAKLVELVDGRVLMSVRRTGARGYNISNDGGQSWGTQKYWTEINANACNGDIIRYSAVDNGGEKNILLHSIPNSRNRENVSIFVSYDEGETWQDPVTLYAGPSVYSSLTILNDGTIGAYIEKNPSGACELWYMNFPFKWLLEQQGN